MLCLTLKVKVNKEKIGTSVIRLQIFQSIICEIYQNFNYLKHTFIQRKTYIYTHTHTHIHLRTHTYTHAHTHT